MLDATIPVAADTVNRAMPSAFDSPAWILVGLTRNVPGCLAYEDGRIALADNDGNVLFVAELSDVSDLKFPWYYFGGGLKMKVLGEKYRVSFVRPNETGRRGLAFLVRIVHDIAAGRAATAKWRAILTRQA